MEDLIKAFQIFLKYGNPNYPTHCEHDVLIVHIVDEKKDVSKEDRKELKKLGFQWDDEFDGFASFKYGSC